MAESFGVKASMCPFMMGIIYLSHPDPAYLGSSVSWTLTSEEMALAARSGLVGK